MGKLDRVIFIFDAMLSLYNHLVYIGGNLFPCKHRKYFTEFSNPQQVAQIG